MPIYRGPDGKIIEEKTRKVQDQAQPTRKVGTAAQASASPLNDEEKTRRLDEPPAAKAKESAAKAKAAVADDERTRLASANLRSATHTGTEKEDALNNPVVGWLVIIDGPGKGSSHQLGFGANPIGRAESERVSLDFGDSEISRHSHALLTYDPRGNTFYLQNGNSLNLTYLNDEPVLSPCILEAHSKIQLGKTTLCFIPLCTQKFNWQETLS